MKTTTAVLALALVVPGLAYAQGGANSTGPTGMGTTSGGDVGSSNGSANTRGFGTSGTNSGAPATAPDGRPAGADAGGQPAPHHTTTQRRHTRTTTHPNAANAGSTTGQTH